VAEEEMEPRAAVELLDAGPGQEGGVEDPVAEADL